MPAAPARASLQAARRLAVHAAMLDHRRLGAGRAGVMQVVEALGRLQRDPTRVVERSHLLVLWSRLGQFDRADLERLLRTERRLLEYDAFIYPAEDYGFVHLRQQLFSTRDSALEKRARAWLKANAAFRRRILARLRRSEPLPSRAFEAPGDIVPWKSGGWTSGRSVNQMFHFMERAGDVMVARREGNERLWDLPGQVLPASVLRQRLPKRGRLELLIERVVRHFGIVEAATVPPYVALADRSATRTAMGSMLEDGQLRRVEVESFGEAVVAADDVGTLRRFDSDDGWHPRTTLLSPFDPLITDRERTKRLFGFDFRLDIYKPVGQREHGYFVMPILHGDRLIGRAEPVFDRRTRAFEVRNLSLERGIGRTPAEVDAAIHALREFAEAGAA